jgi:tetratricopeptide (TPR) repeat protein
MEKLPATRLGLILLIAATVVPVRADILILTNSREMKGVVDEAASDAEKVKFFSATGSIMIPRSRIRTIEHEPESEGYVHIGDDFTRLGDLTQALAAYERALEADPDSETARSRVEEAHQAMQDQEQAARDGQLRQIDDLMKDVRDLIRREEFENAEALLEKTSDLVPNPAQREPLQDLIAELYLAWARERLDKLDTPGAEQKLNLALAASPGNEAVMTLLLTLWEDQPEKHEQTLRVYKTVLDRKPGDDLLRRRVADMMFQNDELDDAIYHYLLLYNKSERFRGTSLETRVVDTLEKLHLRKAQEGDFEKAIYYYNLLGEIVPNLDPLVLTYYRYLNRASQIDSGDMNAQVELAEYAEINGLKSLALENYRRIIEVDPDNDSAREALNRFALQLIGQAEASLDARDYYLARTYADRVIRQYSDSDEAVLRARQIRGIAENEIVRDEREKRELAKEYIQKGDYYYERANQYFRDIQSTESRVNSPYSTPKSDAIRFYEYAIQAYETAIRIDPSLSNNPTSLVGPNLQESKRNLSILTARAPRVGLPGGKRTFR